MGTRINTNVEAFNAQRNLGLTSMQYAKSVEKLSSGLRINRAGDDAAGLSISEKMRAQIRGLAQAQRNAQDGISLIQTAEGGLNEVHSIVQRMRELAVQGSNDTLSQGDRDAVGLELSALNSEVNRIATTTEFNGKTLLSGSLATQDSGTGTLATGALATATGVVVSKVDVSAAAKSATFTLSDLGGGVLQLSDGTNTQAVSVADMDQATGNPNQVLNFSNLGVKITLTGIDTTNGTGANIATDLDTETVITSATGGAASLQIGANANQTMSVLVSDMQSTAIGNGGGYANLNAAASGLGTPGALTSAIAQNLMQSLDAAITDVSNQRSQLGAYQNRLEHTISNLGVTQENLTASESRIRDVDMASEMVNFTKSGILQQAGQAILAQANQAPQGVLALLRG
jgi:flagellin